MAAKNESQSAQKKKQQYILLGVAGIALAALVFFQLPKLTGGGDEAAPADTGAAVADEIVGGPTTVGGKNSAYLVGVAVNPGPARLAPEKGHLASLSRFKAKDPFAQQVSTETASSGSSESSSDKPNAEAAADDAKAAQGQGSGSSAASGDSGEVAGTKPEKHTAATISVNKKQSSVVVDDVFPEKSPMFVLVKLKPGVAWIGVANGGSFGSRDTLKLKLGEPVTLVDSTTGVRYRIVLLYTGTSAEKTAEFSSEEEK